MRFAAGLMKSHPPPESRENSTETPWKIHRGGVFLSPSCKHGCPMDVLLGERIKVRGEFSGFDSGVPSRLTLCTGDIADCETFNAAPLRMTISRKTLPVHWVRLLKETV
jgi:hypothetical protein